MKNKILFYNDSHVWGGHEEMTLLFANSSAEIEDTEVIFVYNHRYFKKRLSNKIKKIKTEIITKTPLPCIRFFVPWEIFSLIKIFKKEAPNIVIVSQGCVERSLKGFFASFISRLKTVSYIPLAFTFKETNSALSFFRDPINRIYYRLPNSYITVSQYQKYLLSRFTSKNQRIELLYNPVNNLLQKNEPSTDVVFSPKCFTLLCAGRIYFRHKNQLILVKAAKILKEKGFKAKFIIAGEGPDLEKLKNMISALDVKDYFEIAGWVEDLRDFIKNSCDVLIVPSFYESCLPLTVLESCAENRPFLVAKKDFSKEYELDENYLFNCESPYETAEKIMNFKNSFSQSSFQKTKEKIAGIHSMKKYSKDVKRILLSYLS